MLSTIGQRKNLTRYLGSGLIILTMASAMAEHQQNNVIEIKNCEGLQNIVENTHANYKLINDIDCYNYNFIPIAGFNGELDGNYKTITSLSIHPRKDETHAALFASVNQQATIKNLKFYRPIIYDENLASASHAAVLVGYANGGIINNVYIHGGTITGEFSQSVVGGLVAEGEDVNILNSHFIGKIEVKTSNVGGLVGLLTKNSQIKFSSTSGTIGTNGKNIGGLVGEVNNSEIMYARSMTQVTSDGKNALFIGGLVGNLISSKIYNSHSTYVEGKYKVKGYDLVGGLVGAYQGNNTISKSYSAGIAKADRISASLVGGRNLSSDRITIIRSYGSEEGNRSNQLGEVKTLDQLKRRSTFSNWDFNSNWSLPVDDKYFPQVLPIINISQCNDLEKISDNMIEHSGLFYRYQLTTDLDCQGYKINTIGDDNGFFTDYFDGNGKTISNLHIVVKENASDLYAGIFGILDYDAAVQNLTLKQPLIELAALSDNDQPDKAIGVIAAVMQRNATLSGVEVIEPSYQFNYEANKHYAVGGLVGKVGNSRSRHNSYNVDIIDSSVRGMKFSIAKADSLSFGGLVGMVDEQSNDETHQLIIARSFVEDFASFDLPATVNYVVGGLIGRIKTENTATTSFVKIVDSYVANNVNLQNNHHRHTYGGLIAHVDSNKKLTLLLKRSYAAADINCGAWIGNDNGMLTRANVLDSYWMIKSGHNDSAICQPSSSRGIFDNEQYQRKYLEFIQPAGNRYPAKNWDNDIWVKELNLFPTLHNSR